MGYATRSTAAIAIAAVVGATISATPVETPAPTAVATIPSIAIDLTGSSRVLPPWPLSISTDRGARRAPEPFTVATMTTAADATPGLDQVDADFIAFRAVLRTDFHEFVNKTGYLGKQTYIAFNFGESIVASAVFNGTDVLRGEGLFKNLGEFAYDVFLAAVYVVADELYLNIPGLPPAVILPSRGPEDHPPGWQAPLPPRPDRPVVVPVNENTSTAKPLDVAVPSPTDDAAVSTGDADTDDAAHRRGSERGESGDSDSAPQTSDSADDTRTDEGAKSRKKRAADDVDEQEAQAASDDDADAADDARDAEPTADAATED